MMALVLYTLLSAALFYLGSRALITQAIWSRYPLRFARFMDCAACTGFWYGIVIAGVARAPYLGLDGSTWLTPPLVGLCSLVLTPLVAGLMQRALDLLGSVDLDPPSSTG